MTINKLKGMKHMKIFVLAALLPFCSFAGMPDGPPSEPPADPVTQQQSQEQSSESSSSSASDASSESSSTSDSDASASSDNSVTVSHNGVRQAPTAIAPNVYPTASCLGGVSGAGSGAGWGAALGFSYGRKECEAVVLAQNLASIGLTEAACQVLMTTKAAKRAGLTTDCRVKLETATDGSAEKQVDLSAYPTRAEVIERDERVLRKSMEK